MKKLKYMLAFILLAGMLTGCADKKETSGQRVFYHSMNEESTQTEKAAKADEELYMIAGLDTANETMRVYRYADGLEYQYHYGLSTEFLNKYGEHTSVVNFFQWRHNSALVEQILMGRLAGYRNRRVHGIMMM